MFTVLTATGFLEGREWAQIYNIAPGERSVPLSIFRDKCFEELAYPGIFLGQKWQIDESMLITVIFANQKVANFNKLSNNI